MQIQSINTTWIFKFMFHCLLQILWKIDELCVKVVIVKVIKVAYFEVSLTVLSANSCSYVWCVNQLNIFYGSYIFSRNISSYLSVKLLIKKKKKKKNCFTKFSHIENPFTVNKIGFAVCEVWSENSFCYINLPLTLNTLLRLVSAIFHHF